MRNMSAETHISLCGRKVWFAQAQESKHALKWKSKHQPCNRKPLGEIGRLSLINIELNLFQELESVVHSVRRLNHDDWFVAVDLLIFHILMIPTKDAPESRQLSANYFINVQFIKYISACFDVRHNLLPKQRNCHMM